MDYGGLSAVKHDNENYMSSNSINESGKSKQNEIKLNIIGTSQKLSEIKKGENKSTSKIKIKKIKIIQSIPKKEEIAKGGNKSLSKNEEIKKEGNILLSKNEESRKKPLLENKKKEGENKVSSDIKEKKDGENQLISNNKIIIEKSESKSSLSKENAKGNIVFFKLYSKMDIIIDFYTDEEDIPLEKYDYFKIDFTICNYLFIVPEPLNEIFSSFYSKILKDSTIFFPKDFQKAKELLNDYEKKKGNKENWIVISPCEEIESDIKAFHENKNIYYFIGYRTEFCQKNNLDLLYKFDKYYGIIGSGRQLVETLIKLNNIFYYRKKQKYGINNNIDDIFDLKYETKFKYDFNNEYSKNHVLFYKYLDLYNFKMSKEKLYFLSIQSLTLLNKYLEEKNYDILFNYVKNISTIIISQDNEKEKVFKTSNFLKNLHILYLYFSNYPYLYGALTYEEIDDYLLIYEQFTNQTMLTIFYLEALIPLINIVDTLASKVNKGISILHDKENLKDLHKLLIDINFVNLQIKSKYKIYEINQYYQIKFYLKDIDFCLCKIIVNFFLDLSNDYPLKSEIINTYLNNDKRLFFYLGYIAQISRQKQNKNEDEQTKAYNKAIKFNNTIVLGDKQFHNIIGKMNIPCKNIVYKNENEFSNFFRVPQKNGKYKICNYFVIMNEKYGKKYIETIRYISCVFGVKLAVIIYIQNKNIKINKIILEHPFIHIVLTYSEKDILNYYNDSYIRLKDINLICENEFEQLSKKIFEININFPKLGEVKIIREQDNGWDMVKDLNANFFNLVKVNKMLGCIDISLFNIDMYKVYKENNCPDLFINHYGNYFSGEYLVEQVTPILCGVKLFLYAYTLEEDNYNKSFYYIMNNDFRSG